MLPVVAASIADALLGFYIMFVKDVTGVGDSLIFIYLLTNVYNYVLLAYTVIHLLFIYHLYT